MSQALAKNTRISPVNQSVEDYAMATVPQSLDRAKDIMRDKKRVVNSFFALARKEPDEIQTADVREWYQTLLDRDLSESYIYVCLSHLSGYFEWLKKLPEFSHFIKINPVRVIMPKTPKKYNSEKTKAMTDDELSKLWHHIENLAQDDKNLVAVRDFALLRMFMATGMRRAEIIAIGAGDIKIEGDTISLHTKVKGGYYDWRTLENSHVVAALERYLKLTKRRSVMGDKNRAFWIRLDRGAEAAKADWKEKLKKNDRAQEPRMASYSFDKQMKRYATDAGIGDFNIHKFRHTFARIVAEDSGSLIETQDALGHKDIKTTQIYVNRIKHKKDKFSRNIEDRIR